MSSVTDMIVIIGDTGHYGGDRAEDIAPKVAEIIRDFIYRADEGETITGKVPVISLRRDDWASLQGGYKVAGSAVIWFGWNYAHPEELEEHLKAQGFKNLTVWSHDEHSKADGIAPRVVSW